MDTPPGYVYKPYPRRLYLEGDVLKQDTVVEDEFAEQVARSRGYRKAWEPAQAPVETSTLEPKHDGEPKHDEAKTKVKHKPPASIAE